MSLHLLKTPTLSKAATGSQCTEDSTPTSQSTAAGDLTSQATRTYPALSIQSYPEKIIRLEYAVRGKIAIRADEIAQGSLEDRPFDKVLQCNIGNPQALGLQPLSYIRETLAMVSCPALLEKSDSELSNLFRLDNIRRARKYMEALKSSGAYTHSLGALGLRREVASFFERRDGYRPSENRIFLTNGASEGINLFLNSLIAGPSDGALLPKPQYPLYAAVMTKLNGTAVYYALDEATNWSLNEKVLSDSYDRATSEGVDVKILVVISPGNPCSTFLERDQIHRILKFAEEKNLLVIADEVYQDNIYGTRPFVSFRRVLLEEKLKTQLLSVHSASKGFYGECGLRGGVCQLENVDDEAFAILYKLRSVDLCSNTLGQVVTTCITNPPQPGEESYELYEKEKNAVLTELATKAKICYEFFQTLKGVTCAPIQAGMYVFPRIDFPKKAVEFAKSQGLSVENFYCLELLEATGIATTPGDGFGQEDGTHHVRMTILPALADLNQSLKLYAKFHAAFMARFE